MPLIRIVLPLFLFVIGAFAQITLNPQSVPGGTINTQYQNTLVATGGSGNYGFAFVGGQLPNGIVFSAGGVLSGTPTAAGNFSFTVRVTDSLATTADFALVLKIASVTGVQITTSSLPDGQVNQQYSSTLSAAGGAGTYSWGLVSGNGILPNGLTFTSSGTILGTPTQAGTFSFVFRVTDGSGGTAQANYTIRVNSNQLAILTSSLPAGSVGASYNQTLSASGGVVPYTFGLASGNLPTGLSLSSGGIVSGTPTASGTFAFTISVADGANSQASRTLSISIGVAQLAINQVALPSGQLGVAYSSSVSATNGTAPYTFSIAAGTLPTGIAFSSSGVFSGTPQASGNFQFSIRVTDNLGATSTASFAIAVNSNSLTIVTNSLSNAVVGQAYSASLIASGGQQPYTFQTIAGTLPTGLSLNTNGTISGTPISGGNSSFTVRVTDASFSVAQASLNIIVNSSGLTFVSTALPNGQTGQTYTGTLTASGGTTPYSYVVQNGSLPPGLTLGANGNISGTPTTAGTYQATYRVQDGVGVTALATISITIGSGSVVTITTVQLPSGSLSQAYNATVQATGGTTPYSFFAISGNLPSGIFLNPNGLLSGTPNVAGAFNFTVRVTDNAGNQAQVAFTININNSSILLSNATLPSAQLNVAYSSTLTATGGTSPYIYSVTGGTLPNGISVASNGLVSGTPTTSGTYNFTVRVQDNIAANSSFNVLLSVNSSSLAVATTTLPIGITGVSYSGLITATGGTGPYLFDITAGSLPSGLSVTQAGGISGVPTTPGTFNFTIRATDSVNGTAIANLGIIVNTSGTLTITTISLPQVAVGQVYGAALSATGGSFPYNYSVISGSLPPGLTLSSTGAISGTPTSPGNYGFVVRLQDNSGSSTQASLSIVVTANGLFIATTSIPNAPLGSFYTTTLSASGGSAPYSWSIVSGTLPNGITLASNGVLSGLASVAGNYPLTVRVTDTTNASAQANFTFLVASNFLSITTSSIPQSFIGQQFALQLTATGGSVPYQFSVASGTLPAGLQLSSNGLLFGTPTVSAFAPVVFRVTDSNGGSATFSTNVVVGQSTLQITTSFLPSVSSGQLYNLTLQATGGSTPYVFSLSSGSLPSGFLLSAGGVLSGTTNNIGIYNLTVRVQDAAGATNQANLVLNVVAGALQITTASLPAARLNQAYSTILQTSGGTLPVRFELLATINLGFPPPGINVSAAGAISGTPQATGSYTFSVRATDAQSLTAQATYTLVVGVGGPTITTTSLPAGFTSQAYNQSISATGGTTPYTYSILTGFLPTGLSLNPSSGILSGTPTAAGSYTFTVRVADSASQTADATYAVTITNDTTALSINALAPPPGIVFFPYSFTLTATGGKEPYTWSIPVGPIPNGLRLDANGNLNGLLLSPGTYRFTVRVTDFNNKTAETTLAITVAGATRLAQARVGASYTAQAPNPAFGRAPFTYSLNASAIGDLPPGIVLNGNGSFSGTPTAAGEFTFGLLATDASGFRTNLAATIGVTGGNFLITTPGLPGGAAGTPYSQTLSANGGSTPYNWVVASGSLPNGLTLNPLNGQITGTPTIQGTNFFTVRVGDTNGSSATAYYGISIGAPGSPVINAVTSAASYGSNGIAPGELLTIFGGTLGPQNLTAFTLVNNVFPTLIAGTRVLFDGVAAPLIYTQAGQISAIAPYNLATKQSVRVVVEYVGFQSTPYLLPVLSSKPGLFTVDGSGQGPGAILNQNGSVNTSGNRAAKESIVVLYLTGGGAMVPAGQDGQVSSGTSSLNLQTLVTINGQPSTVLYSGNAPGLVQGVIQVNVKLPLVTVPAQNTIIVQIGPNSTTSVVTVWVE